MIKAEEHIINPDYSQSAKNNYDENIKYINSVVGLFSSFLKQKKEIYVSMKKVLLLLHDILFHLSAEPELQNSISIICEDYYKENLPDKEMIIPQLIPYLILRCLDEGGSTFFIKRLYYSYI